MGEHRPGARAALEAVEEMGAVDDKAEQRALRMAPTYGDLIAEPAPGWAMFAENAPYDRGRHGTTQELELAFLVSGSGVCARPLAPQPPTGRRRPTINHLLGVRAPSHAQGRALTEVLIPPRR